MHSTSTLTSTDGNNNNKLSEEGKNYLAVPLKRKIIDLMDVPSQPPIPKRGRIKDGASKYTGASFNKQVNKWLAQIMIEKKPYCIGYYESEEEAAVDYARALFKYKGQGAIDKAREQRVQNLFVDLTGAPLKSPIPKSAGRMKEGASKYAGIYFRKETKKWSAQIRIDGTKRIIGYYENEEEAAVDYARAVFKYGNGGAKGRAHQQQQQPLVLNLSDVPPQSSIPKNNLAVPQKRKQIDLSDVPPQLLIPESAGRIKEGSSQYVGVSYYELVNK